MKKHPAKTIAALLLTAALAFSTLSFTGCAPGKPTPTAAPAPTPRPTATPEPQTYTFNRALTLFPSNWNPHSYALPPTRSC